MEYFGRKDKQEVRKSLSPTQGTSNGSLEGVLDLCTPRKTSTGVANPLPEERGGGEGGKEATEEDQIGSGEMAPLPGIQAGKLRGVGRYHSRHPGWEPGKEAKESKDKRIVTPAARKRGGKLKLSI